MREFERESSTEEESSAPGEGKKRSLRWKLTRAGIWGTGGLVVFTALTNSLGVGALGALLGGAYGYKRRR